MNSNVSRSTTIALAVLDLAARREKTQRGHRSHRNRSAFGFLAGGAEEARDPGSAGRAVPGRAVAAVCLSKPQLFRWWASCPAS